MKKKKKKKIWLVLIQEETMARFLDLVRAEKP
jgi:hypothetical protein